MSPQEHAHCSTLKNSPTAPTLHYNIRTSVIKQLISPHTTALQTTLNSTAYKKTANYTTPQQRTPHRISTLYNIPSPIVLHLPIRDISANLTIKYPIADKTRCITTENIVSHITSLCSAIQHSTLHHILPVHNMHTSQYITLHVTSQQTSPHKMELLI